MNTQRETEIEGSEKKRVRACVCVRDKSGGSPDGVFFSSFRFCVFPERRELVVGVGT